MNNATKDDLRKFARDIRNWIIATGIAWVLLVIVLAAFLVSRAQEG